MAGAAAMAATPALARRQDPLILGSGSHRYRCEHNWLTAPEGLKFGDTHGLAQDSKGRIYVAHTVHAESASADAVVVYDEQGKFLKSWGAEFRGGAHGLDIRTENGQEVLYHCDIARKIVVKTDLDGKVLQEIGVPHESGKYAGGQPYVPTNVAFHPGGGFFVADGYGSHWVHEFTAKGELRNTFGGPGKEKGQLLQPHGLWLDDRGKEPLLAVADRSNRRIQYFNLEGEHVKFVSEGIRLPCHFQLRQGVMLVPDLESVVTLLDENNRVIASLGDGHPTNLRGKPESEFIAGKFIHPHDAMFLRNGDILVAEWVPQGRITRLVRV